MQSFLVSTLVSVSKCAQLSLTEFKGLPAKAATAEIPEAHRSP